MSVRGPEELMSRLAAWAAGDPAINPVARSVSDAARTVSRNQALFI
jgi:hypothetical protein